MHCRRAPAPPTLTLPNLPQASDSDTGPVVTAWQPAAPKGHRALPLCPGTAAHRTCGRARVSKPPVGSRPAADAEKPCLPNTPSSVTLPGRRQRPSACRVPAPCSPTSSRRPLSSGAPRPMRPPHGPVSPHPLAGGRGRSPRATHARRSHGRHRCCGVPDPQDAGDAARPSVVLARGGVRKRSDRRGTREPGRPEGCAVRGRVPPRLTGGGCVVRPRGGGHCGRGLVRAPTEQEEALVTYPQPRPTRQWGWGPHTRWWPHRPRGS